ncbi:MAG: lytic transglycosylase [Rhodocyclaceae bacterium]|nr:lytic transglycosylase [Rhodocyclaceae bacterium]
MPSLGDLGRTAMTIGTQEQCPAIFRLCLAAAAALAFTQGAEADIYMRDEGAGGIVLSDLPGKDAAWMGAENSRAALPDAARPQRPGRKTASRQRLAPLVAAAAASHDLPEDLLTAVIEVESNFNPGAVSPKGAQGLMQLMPGTARYLKVEDARDPAANIDAGARYLKELLGRYDNNLSLALAAYNAGPASVRRSGGAIPAYPETRRYVPQVIRRYHSLQSSPDPR